MYTRADGSCCFCGRFSSTLHTDVATEETASADYHALAAAVRFDEDRPNRHDGSLLNYAVAVADAYAERRGLPRFDSHLYVAEGAC